MKMKQLIHSFGLLAISSLMAQADLIGQWNFANTNLNDVVTGTAHRLILQTNGVQSLTPVFSTATPFGTGVSLDLTGQSNCVYVLTSNDGSGSFEPSNMTYSAWVKINGWTSTDNQYECIFSKQGAGPTGLRLCRFSNSSYTGIQFLGTGAQSALDSSAQVNVADGLWHLVAFTYDSASSNLTYYIDGVQIAQNTSLYNPAATSPLTIGAWNISGLRSINGLVYDVRIYNNALSAAEIANLTNAPSTVLFSDSFDAAKGTDLFTPAGRAYGTLASQVYYGWFSSVSNLVVNGTLSWNSNGTASATFNELPASPATGLQNLRFASSANSGFYDWYPSVGGKVWDVQYDVLTGNSQSLVFGLSHITRNGSYGATGDTNYDFAIGNFGTGCRVNAPVDSQTNYVLIPNIFPTRTNVYNVRIRFDEPLQTATLYVNGAQVVQTNIPNIGLGNHRYLSWGEPNNFGGYIDNLTISLAPSIPVVPSGPTLSAVSPNPVTGSSYPVTLTLTGSGFTGATGVLLTNLTSSTGGSYGFNVNTDTNISVTDFVPGTAASSWNATVVNGSPSAQVGFTVNAASAVTINQNALTSAGAGKLVLSGAGGGAGNRYAVLSATNLAPPVVWTPFVTNAFDGSGNFNYTNSVSFTPPNLFLRIQQ